MKPQANNEIDLLLRRMSGRDSGATSTANNQHLDADELSSYAQNALPPAARARYTEHLADCASCRKVVTELSLSLGTVAVAESLETVPEPSGLKRFLASLFSPLVLRYAVPALGVIVVMIVGFVVLRQQRQHQLVATMNQPQNESVTVASPPPAQGFYDKQSRTPEPSQSSEPKSNETRAKNGAVAGAGAGAVSTAPATVAKDDRAIADLRPSAAAAPAPPAAAKAATPTEGEAQSTETVAKKQPAEAKASVEPAKQTANEPAREQVHIAPLTTTANRNEQAKDKSKSAPSDTSGFLGGVARKRGTTDTTRQTADSKREDEKSADADQADEETRTIAGRHFRKQRGVWTDTAYDSSTATVNMARDSEQFRALVADEPAIGTIAKQLDGEIIVIWKRRAYRIR